CSIIIASATFGQERESPTVTVTGENESEHDQFTELGEYAQPAWAERSRLSSTTNVYVLSPYEMFIGNRWEGDFPGRGKSGDDFVYGLNVALQRHVSHDNGREFEMTQAIMYGMSKGKVELGAESRYTHITGRGRLDEQNELVIGPSFGWKPTRQIRAGLSPLFG